MRNLIGDSLRWSPTPHPIADINQFQRQSQPHEPLSAKFQSKLASLIPVLKDLMLLTEHNIGESYYEAGSGVENLYETNYIFYDEDGWTVTIEYRCCGEWYHDSGDSSTPPDHGLRTAFGDLVSVEAIYDDDLTGESHVYSQDELGNLWFELEASLHESLSLLI